MEEKFFEAAKRAAEMPPFIVMEILERAHALEAAGRNIVHMEIGEPDFETPVAAKEAAIEAIACGKTKYTHSLGLPALREAISRHYKEKYGAEIDPGRIIVCAGTSPAMLLAFAALLEHDDEVILSNPSYPCYPNFVRFVGGAPIFVRTNEEDGFQFRAEEVAKSLTQRTKAIILNSPANPAGTLMPAESMRKIAEIAASGPFIVSDEIYHGLVYGEKEHSVLEFTDRAFVLNGFSKLYAMTGWRLGYLIAPPEFVRPIQKMQQNLFISANAFVQLAGVAALEKSGPEIEEMVKTYDERRRFLIPRLRELGFGIAKEPTGAFYILANAKHLSNDSYTLAFDILEKVGVAVTPGIDFGTGAEGFLRFSYASSIENLEEGCRRLEKYLAERG